MILKLLTRKKQRRFSLGPDPKFEEKGKTRRAAVWAREWAPFAVSRDSPQPVNDDSAQPQNHTK
jgi:hypothetical protein